MVANLQTKPTGYNLASTGDGGSTGSKFLCAFSPKHLHAYFCLIHRRSVVATNFICLRLSSHSFHVPSSMSMLLAFACICQHLAWRSHTRCRCASCRAAAAKPSCRPRGDSCASPRRSWRSKDVQSTGMTSETSETSETSDKCEQRSLSVHVWVEIKPGQSHFKCLAVEQNPVLQKPL